MPIAALWSLIVGLVILALGLTYKVVEFSHALKLSDKEADRLGARLLALEETRNNEALSSKAEIDVLKEAHNKEISDIKELHNAELDKFSKHIDPVDLSKFKKRETGSGENDRAPEWSPFD